MNDDDGVPGTDACSLEATINRSRRSRVHFHLEWIDEGVRPFEPQRRQQIPLVRYRRTRSFISWTSHQMRVHP